MTDPESTTLPATKKKRVRWLKYFLVITLVLLFLTYLFIFFGFNYFGERFLRRVLREKIESTSHGLYSADFRKMNFNIITGKVTIDSFQLIPDTLRYRLWKTQGKITQSLYHVTFVSLTIDRLHAWQIYTQRRINLRQLTIVKPVISIVGFPDTVTARKSRWRIIYEDIYPAISKVFNDFHVDSVILERGFLLTSFRHKTGKLTSGEYEFSSILRDVSVNPFSYYNRERVFYSRDINWVIYNFEYALADSLYSLRAEEAGFSLAHSRLYGKQLTLRPNFKSLYHHEVKQGDFFELRLPSFSIDGINMYRALVDKKVEVKKLLLHDFSMKMYRNQNSTETVRAKKNKKKITVAGLYTVVSGLIENITIDTISLSHASFEYYSGWNQRRPEMKIDNVDLHLSEFYLDSIAWQNTKKIFYAREIELDMKGFNLNLKDQIHTLHARRLTLSTRRSTIRLSDGLLYPDLKKNELLVAGRKNTIYFQLPSMTFNHIDLKKFFNWRILDFDVLDIMEPDLKITRFRPPRNKDPRFRRPEDFFDEENEGVVYDLLKKYIQVIKGNEIRIHHGYGQLTRNQDGIEKKVAAASFDLVMEQFLIDSVHGMNRQGYFYSRDFDLDLHSISLQSPDTLRRLNIDQLHIDTQDSLIEAEGIRLIKSGRNLTSKENSKRHPPLSVEFTLKRLHLTGLNHRRLFLDNVLKANQIILENPILVLKTESQLTFEKSVEESQLHVTGDPIRNFEIGRLLVKQGTFSYDGQEDRKASYFSLKDIDFTVVNASVRLPRNKSHDGLIRFDSLQLSVFPFRATIADSMYQLEAKSLGVNSYPATIIALGLKITPLRPLNALQNNSKLVTAKIPELRITGFYFDRAIFENEWVFNRILVEEPSVFVEVKKEDTENLKSNRNTRDFSIKLPPFMKTLDVRSLMVNSAQIGVNFLHHDSVRSYSFDDIQLEVNRFLVDSTTRANPANTPLFNAENISLAAPGFSGITTDSMYTYGFYRFGFSTKTQKGYIDSVSFVPNFNRYEFSRRLKYQADRLVLRIPRIDIEKINFRKLLTDRQFTAGVIHLNGLNFESYRDKRIPFPQWQRPLLPQEMFRKSPVMLNIDTIYIKNGFAAYEEQTGDEPGRIFFERVNGTLTGASQTASSLDFQGTSFFMGNAPVEAWFHFLMDHPRDSMTIKATIGTLDLRDINPMLTRLMPASIYRGNASQTDIGPIYMNDSLAHGHLVMYYSDLAIKLRPTEPGTWPRIKTAALNEAANILLPENNPKDNGKLRTGLVFFERDQSKGFFNFVWKSVLSGIKSNAGFNTKAQKELLKSEKRKKK
jgi:hypothetical protein